jgi:hypothetical protein
MASLNDPLRTTAWTYSLAPRLPQDHPEIP